MTAELLREAAAKMRERAEAATPGPWEIWEGRRDLSIESTVAEDSNGNPLPIARTFPWEGARPDAEHIASWHPPVALAVADWMDWMAGRAASGNSIPAMRGQGLEQALAVARAYLGRES